MKTIDVKRLHRKYVRTQVLTALAGIGVTPDVLKSDPESLDEELLERAVALAESVRTQAISLRQFARENGHEDVLIEGRAGASLKHEKSSKTWNATPYRKNADRKNKQGKQQKKVKKAESEEE